MLKSVIALKQRLYKLTDFVIKKSSFTFNGLFAAISLYGVNNEPDESKQKYIIQLNLIAVATFIINLITGVLFFFLVDISPGISFIISAVMWLLPIYINRNGLKISSRIIPVCFTLAALLLSSCWYTHDTMLDSYFLIVAINSTFMYSPEERKWQIIFLVLASILFVIESTSLQNHLPAFNKLKFTPVTNEILLSGEIMTVLIDVIIYAYISGLRERNLLIKQKQIEEARARVEVQNDDLKTFSLAASHSMQTPLYVSTYFLDKIEAEVRPTANDRLRKNLEFTKSGLQQISQLAEGLFAYDRIINIEIELTEFDVIKQINIQQKSISLKYPAAKIVVLQPYLFIKANQLLFSTILHNLIDNGIKYNRSDIPEVRINCTKTDNGIVILIIDNGTGIPEKFLKTIFEPLKRVQSDTNINPGNGLGLACSKRAAERMGGNLICQQSNKSGSIFKLELPC